MAKGDEVIVVYIGNYTLAAFLARRVETLQNLPTSFTKFRRAEAFDDDMWKNLRDMITIGNVMP